jgi:putative glycosyltransferase (TIGR04348 family)
MTHAFDHKKQVCIVTPAMADANNGNWQTARRWARFLTPLANVRIVRQWPDSDMACSDHALLALHARRSADSIAHWHDARGTHGLGVVLTGTDLYRDILENPAAQRSLNLAQCLVVLQDQGPKALPAAVRHKARIVFQSCSARKPVVKRTDHIRAVMVGHLRQEKTPQTLLDAAYLLGGHPDIRIDHIGQALDPALGRSAYETTLNVPNYRWLGGLTHEATRRRIQHAHVLVHTSQMEGGAHVIMEAVRSGTPVLASHVPGNVGMLGTQYMGYFPWSDAQALAALLQTCLAGQHRQDGGLLSLLTRQCAERALLFSPAAERAALRQLVGELSGAH